MVHSFRGIATLIDWQRWIRSWRVVEIVLVFCGARDSHLEATGCCQNDRAARKRLGVPLLWRSTHRLRAYRSRTAVLRARQKRHRNLRRANAWHRGAVTKLSGDFHRRLHSPSPVCMSAPLAAIPSAASRAESEVCWRHDVDLIGACIGHRLAHGNAADSP